MPCKYSTAFTVAQQLAQALTSTSLLACANLAGDFCHPGTSKGGRGKKAYNERVTCPALHMALTDDGAVQVSRQEALTGQPEQVCLRGS